MEIVRKGAIVFAALGFSMLAIEVFLRVAGWQAPSDAEPHPIYGWKHLPSRAGWVSSPEYSVYSSTNSKGFWDQEHEYSKPPGTYRVLVLGDSFSASMLVPWQDSWPQVMSRALTQDCGSAAKPEVVIVPPPAVGGFVGPTATLRPAIGQIVDGAISGQSYFEV